MVDVRDGGGLARAAVDHLDAEGNVGRARTGRRRHHEQPAEEHRRGQTPLFFDVQRPSCLLSFVRGTVNWGQTPLGFYFHNSLKNLLTRFIPRIVENALSHGERLAMRNSSAELQGADRTRGPGNDR